MGSTLRNTSPALLPCLMGGLILFVRKLKWKSPVRQNSHLIFFLLVKWRCGTKTTSYQVLRISTHRFCFHIFPKRLKAQHLEKANKLATWQVKSSLFPQAEVTAATDGKYFTSGAVFEINKDALQRRICKIPYFWLKLYKKCSEFCKHKKHYLDYRHILYLLSLCMVTVFLFYCTKKGQTGWKEYYYFSISLVTSSHDLLWGWCRWSFALCSHSSGYWLSCRELPWLLM